MICYKIPMGFHVFLFFKRLEWSPFPTKPAGGVCTDNASNLNGKWRFLGEVKHPVTAGKRQMMFAVTRQVWRSNKSCSASSAFRFCFLGPRWTRIRQEWVSLAEVAVLWRICWTLTSKRCRFLFLKRVLSCICLRCLETIKSILPNGL